MEILLERQVKLLLFIGIQKWAGKVIYDGTPVTKIGSYWDINSSKTILYGLENAKYACENNIPIVIAHGFDHIFGLADAYRGYVKGYEGGTRLKEGAMICGVDNNGIMWGGYRFNTANPLLIKKEAVFLHGFFFNYAQTH